MTVPEVPAHLGAVQQEIRLGNNSGYPGSQVCQPKARFAQDF